MANTVNTDWNAVIASAQSQIKQIDAQIAQLEKTAAAKGDAAEKAANDAYRVIKAKQDAELKVVSDQIQSINSQIFALRDQLGNITPTFDQLNDARIVAAENPSSAALKAAYESLKAKRNAALAPYNSKIEALEKQRQTLATKSNQIESTYAPQLKAAQQQIQAAINLTAAEVKQGIELDDKKAQLREQIAVAQTNLSNQAKGTTPATTNVVSATKIPATSKPGNATVATTTTTTVATTRSSNTSTKTTVTSTSNSTAISTDPTVNRALTTESLVDANGQPTRSSDPSINRLLTDADKPLVDDAGNPTSSSDPSINELLTDGNKPLVDPTQIVVDIPTVELPVIEEPALPGEIFDAQTQATAQDEAQFAAAKDWRVRLALAPGSDYFYNGDDAGIMGPLKDTDGVIFPYTPAISVNYTAKYDESNIVHSNYKVYQYSSSAVEQVSITGDFTCQDVKEAQYLLAVIHFFRSMTKMFYGQDKKPRNGTPPPLCYIYGMGGYQFAAHPLAITSFSYSLPQDVDYIKTTGSAAAGPSTPVNKSGSSITNRLKQIGAAVGGFKPGAAFSTASNNATVTWVPTRIQLAITCLPIMSRNQVSNNFSLEKYASGNLLLGTQNKGGGFW